MDSIQPRQENGKYASNWFQKFVSHLKTVAITSLVFICIGLYLWVHAEIESNKKTIELKDQQIQSLQTKLDSVVDFK